MVMVGFILVIVVVVVMYRVCGDAGRNCLSPLGTIGVVAVNVVKVLPRV